MDAARSVPYEREEGTYDTPSKANISILQYSGRQHILAFCTKCVWCPWGWNNDTQTDSIPTPRFQTEEDSGYPSPDLQFSKQVTKQLYYFGLASLRYKFAALKLWGGW